MGGGESQQGLHISELRHRCFSSSERLVGILGSILEPPSACLRGGIPYHFYRGAVWPKLARNVKIAFVRPWHFIAHLRNFSAASRYRRFLKQTIGLN